MDRGFFGHSSTLSLVLNNTPQMAWRLPLALLTASLFVHRAASSAPPTPWISVFTTLITDADSLDQKMIIQENAVAALQALHPFVDVTVYTNTTLGQQLCARLGVRCSDRYQVNEHSTPILKSMYLDVESRSVSQFYGYANADILFDKSLLATLAAVRNAVHSGRVSPRVLIIGRRLNFVMPGDLSRSSKFCFNSGTNFSSTLQYMRTNASMFANFALDFFFVTKHAFNWTALPDFVIGRVAYDNWIVDHAIHTNVTVVDATSTLLPIHQTGVDGNKAGHRQFVDGTWNSDIVSRVGGGYDHGGACNAAWKTAFKNNRVLLVPRLLPGFDPECQEVMDSLHPDSG